MPEAIRYQVGDTIDYTPGADVAEGDVVVQGNHVRVAERPIAAGVKGAIATKGVFQFTKNAPLVITAGDKLYWDVADEEINKTASGNILAGEAVESQLSADTTVLCRLGQPVDAVA